MRTHSDRAPFHALRAATLATATVALAASAHLFAGGQLPAPGIVLALLALTGTRVHRGHPPQTRVPGGCRTPGRGTTGPARILHRVQRRRCMGAADGTCRCITALLTSRQASPPLRLEHVQAHDLDPALALADAGRPCRSHSLVRPASRQGRGRLVDARRVAPSTRPATLAGSARRRRRTGGSRPGARCLPDAVAEPAAGLPPRPARRRRGFLTSSWPRTPQPNPLAVPPRPHPPWASAR